MDPKDLLAVAAACRGALDPFVEADWERPAGDLEWSCRTTLAHISSALAYYAVNLATRSEEERTGGQTNEALDIPYLLDAIEGRAAVLATVVRAAPADARGMQSWGRSDPDGFIAMGCDEMLIHTHDIASGLGATLEAPAGVPGGILERLFPWAPSGQDEWATLLWANGRATLGDRPRLDPEWVWLSAPLAEWNGEDPNR
jgi:Mycothiol maleylpyruvate isomerase N-terminal domain